jgi:hypothetical protein
MKSQSNLFEIILTLSPASGLSRLLNRGQKECNQHCNNRNDNKQFNQRESTLSSSQFNHFRLSRLQMNS